MRLGLVEVLKEVLFDLLVSLEKASLRSKQRNNEQCSHSLSIRDFFTLQEEAMILMVVRKHFVQRLRGSRVLKGYWPDPANNDVSGDNVLGYEDARYYLRLTKALKQQDELAVDSLMAKDHDSFAIPGRCNKRIRLSKDHHQYPARHHGQHGLWGWNQTTGGVRG